MTNKRKFYFTYSNNIEKEKYIIKREFNEMLRDIFMRNWFLIFEILIINLIILLLLYFSLNIVNDLYKWIIIIWLSIIFLLYPIILYKKWKK